MLIGRFPFEMFEYSGKYGLEKSGSQRFVVLVLCLLHFLCMAFGVIEMVRDIGYNNLVFNCSLSVI